MKTSLRKLETFHSSSKRKHESGGRTASKKKSCHDNTWSARRQKNEKAQSERKPNGQLAKQEEASEDFLEQIVLNSKKLDACIEADQAVDTSAEAKNKNESNSQLSSEIEPEQAPQQKTTDKKETKEILLQVALELGRDNGEMKKKRKKILVDSNWSKLRSEICKQNSKSNYKKLSQNMIINKKEKSLKNHEHSKHMDTDAKLTKVIALDCEFVGVGKTKEDALARVSIVNFQGNPIYNVYVKPKEAVTDYRTWVSGITASDLESSEAVSFEKAQKHVAEILRGRILVGHALQNDLRVLMISHPKKMIRDTSSYFRAGGHLKSLKRLSSEKLGIEIQKGSHDSTEDARVALMLYKSVAKKWEASLIAKKFHGKK